MFGTYRLPVQSILNVVNRICGPGSPTYLQDDWFKYLDSTNPYLSKCIQVASNLQTYSETIKLRFRAKKEFSFERKFLGKILS